MEMTDLKAAIDDYTDTAEVGLMEMRSRLDGLETRLGRPAARAPSRPPIRLSINQPFCRAS